MKLRNPFLVNTIGVLGACLLRRLLGTLDVRLDFGPWGNHPRDPRTGRFIYVFWHETLILSTIARARAAVLISQHADGELIAQVIRHLRFGVVRGSSTRGGTAALRNLIAVSEHSNLCITPDGPRGPRRTVQPGAIFVASQTGLPIVPIGIGYANAWRARSWDKFAIPKPFSGARAVFGEPIFVPRHVETRNLLDSVHLLQDRLDEVTASAEAWALGEPRKTAANVALPGARSA